MTTHKRKATRHPLSQVQRKQLALDHNAWKPFADAVVRAGLRVTRDSATVKLSDFVAALIDEINNVDFAEAMISKVDTILYGQRPVGRRAR